MTTFDAFRAVQGPPVTFGASPYHLSSIQSAAWHDRGREGEVVRAEIRAVATAHSVPIYDANGKRLEGP